MTFLKDESGGSMVEYAIIIGIISVAAIVALVALGPQIKNYFNKANNEMDNAK